MEKIHSVTPIHESPLLNRQLNRRVLVKMECYQPSGSFKLRGIGHLMAVRAVEGQRRFVSSSGGNAGLAVAYSARKLGLDAVFVVPRTTPPSTRELLVAHGAEVTVHGAVWDEADGLARDLARTQGAVYVSPFDDPLLWDGHATMIDEAASEISPPDAVLLSVGGGGLLCGVLSGMHRNGWQDVPLVAVETEGAASYASALSAGHPVTLDGIDSIAKSLGACRVADESVHWARRHRIHSVLVSDEAAIAACRSYAEHFRVLVEPACGAALAAIRCEEPALASAATVLVIGCGGAVMVT